MSIRNIILVPGLMLFFLAPLKGQFADSAFHLSATIYDASYHPVPATHVINMNSHQGAVTDTLGIFKLPVHLRDTLLIRNIAFYDTLVPVYLLNPDRTIILTRKRYHLQEARIFEWGSTYADFKTAIIEMPHQHTLSESLGLPRQDPDYVPFDMNEELIKSPAFLISSPISFFYQNFSKEAKSARKVYWLKKNQAKHEHFNEIVSGESLAEITGLHGNELLEFQAFLMQRMVSTFKSSDLEIYKEIHGLWKIYQELKEKGIIN
ncbi:MAG: hypothetical protein ABFS28_11735 [Bacteroidota bacterium]